MADVTREAVDIVLNAYRQASALTDKAGIPFAPIIDAAVKLFIHEQFPNDPHVGPALELMDELVEDFNEKIDKRERTS